MQTVYAQPKITDKTMAISTTTRALQASPTATTSTLSSLCEGNKDEQNEHHPSLVVARKTQRGGWIWPQSHYGFLFFPACRKKCTPGTSRTPGRKKKNSYTQKKIVTVSRVPVRWRVNRGQTPGILGKTCATVVNTLNARRGRERGQAAHIFLNMERLRTSGMVMSSSCILEGLKGNLMGNANLVSISSVLSDTGSVSWLRSWSLA